MVLDSHYDDFIRLSEFPLEPEMTELSQAAPPVERPARDIAIAIVLRESLKAHVKAGSRLTDGLRDAIALLLWADTDRSAIAPT